MSGNAYRILSLDGGGPWTLIQAKALGRLFGGNTRGHDILKRFDLVAGNSGGSVILASLACDRTPDEIFGLLNTEKIRRSFFQDTWYAGLTRRIGLGPRYRADRKIAGMRSFLDGAVLGRSLADLPGSLGLRTQFLITAFDYDRRRAVYFRSNTASLAGTPPSAPSTVTLEQAVHASSEAPINYFNGPAEFEVGGGAGVQRRRFWDGGLSGLNNPVFAAVVEALANGQPRERIQVLSIGSGTVMLPIEDGTIGHPWAQRQAALGIFHDVRKAVSTIMDDPPDAATFHAYVALGQPLPQSDRISVVRMNPIIQPKWDPVAGRWQPRTDLSLEEFSGLVDMDLDPMRQKEIDLIVKFCDLWLANSIWNQPIRPGQDMSCDIGHRTFEDARAAWNGLAQV